MWMIISLFDNDFYFDLEFLGETLTRMIRFYQNELPAQSELTDQFKSDLRNQIADLMYSIFQTRSLLGRKHNLSDEPYREYFANGVKVWIGDNEVDEAFANYILCDGSRVALTSIVSLKDLPNTFGNNEFLVIYSGKVGNESIVEYTIL